MRLILKSDPVRVMASGGQAVNHLNETYDGQVPDIWDHGYVIVDFASGARAMLELCMFAEGAEFQEHIIATGPDGVAQLKRKFPSIQQFWLRGITTDLHFINIRNLWIWCAAVDIQRCR